MSLDVALLKEIPPPPAVNVCPLCGKELTVLDPDNPVRTGLEVPADLAALQWAGCMTCTIMSVEPYTDWFPFDEDMEHC